MIQPLHSLSEEDLFSASEKTLNTYEKIAEQFWNGTYQHDVGQNIDALLRHIDNELPLEILDFGCGPGRDLRTFSALGHNATGIDGCKTFVEMAKRYANCEVLHQDFLRLDLPQNTFDGIFANASLFHIATQELPRVLRKLYACLKPNGVLFCSNPRGPNIEQFTDGRYGAFLTWNTWQSYLLNAGFAELEHYYRPPNLPRNQQPWLASLWRRTPNVPLLKPDNSI
jgi:2-polyprenyl-3-methyl-5-hydroxy-6-metoxy-1,4-benzoquinol methylase